MEYSADLLSKAEADITSCTPTVFSDSSSHHKLFVHIPISIFKFYLHRILLASLKASRDDPVYSIMLFFNKTEVQYLLDIELIPPQF